MADDAGGNTNISLVKLIPEKVVEKVYDDALSKSSQQVGKLSEDALKTARLILAPIQILGALSDRFEGWVETIRHRVPEERRTQAPPEIAGPVIERMKYLEDSNPLQQLYLNLLTRAIDKERQSEAHPAFTRIIEQLSRDEASLMGVLSEQNITIDQIFDPAIGSSFPIRLQVDTHNIPLEFFLFPNRIPVYFQHLDSLGLVVQNRHPRKATEEPRKPGSTREVKPMLFGRLFIKACIPENWKEVFRH